MRKCPQCNKEIEGHGRKKFCSQLCRNQYHNANISKHRGIMKSVNYRLQKNCRILQRLNPTGKRKVSRATLINNDFDFNYYTNVFRTNAGKIYKYCYEQGYLDIGNDMFLLVELPDD